MENMKRNMTTAKRNGFWTKPKAFVLTIIFLLSIISYFIYQFNTYHTIKFELIYEKKLNSNFYNTPNPTIWYTLKSNSFNGFDKNSPEYFDDIKLDYNKYTYIVVNDYQLKKLKYTWKEVNLRKMVIFPDLYVGFATLDKQKTGKTYLYRIKKMNIDSDYHGKNSRNTFSD